MAISTRATTTSRFSSWLLILSSWEWAQLPYARWKRQSPRLWPPGPISFSQSSWQLQCSASINPSWNSRCSLAGSTGSCYLGWLSQWSAVKCSSSWPSRTRKPASYKCLVTFRWYTSSSSMSSCSTHNSHSSSTGASVLQWSHSHLTST